MSDDTQALQATEAARAAALAIVDSAIIATPEDAEVCVGTFVKIMARAQAILCLPDDATDAEVETRQNLIVSTWLKSFFIQLSRSNTVPGNRAVKFTR